jgi:glycosyltransferase involved in cell wall biosynthesis
VFGQGYKEFQSNAFCYIHATSVGGTHPALIEGMGYGNCVIVNGTPENIEVVGDAAIIFDENSEEALYKKLDYVINGNCPIDEYKKKAQEKIKENYSWNSIAEKYESLFLSLNK